MILGMLLDIVRGVAVWRAEERNATTAHRAFRESAKAATNSQDVTQ